MSTSIARVYNAMNIEQRVGDGYLDATAMCQANGKRLNDYLRLDATKSYLADLSLDTGIPVSTLVQVRKGGNRAMQGTWVHPEVAIDLAAWVSNKFRIQVGKWVRELLTTGSVSIQPTPPPKCPMQAYINRYLAGFEIEEALPPGYWCTFIESRGLLIGAEQMFTAAGLDVDYDDLLDGSVGTMWAKERKGQPWATREPKQYRHRFPPPSNRAKAEIWALCYNDAELPYFRSFISVTYPGQHFPKYIGRKYGRDGLAKAIPQAKRFFPPLTARAIESRAMLGVARAV